MPNKTYQIKITLKRSKPSIWRRILIPSDLPLADFHKVIQTTMGWTNSHLHQFSKNRSYYAPVMDEDYGDYNSIDYKGYKVSDLLKKEKDKITYEYDFGDDWIHEILLEKIEDKEMENNEAICIKGKNNCPPEDCGGMWGYYAMMEIINDPNHPEHEDYKEWLGEDYDPTYFNKDEINKMLASDDYGIIDMFDLF